MKIKEGWKYKEQSLFSLSRDVELVLVLYLIL